MINNNFISQANPAKYLGIVLHTRLNWKEQVNASKFVNRFINFEAIQLLKQGEIKRKLMRKTPEHTRTKQCDNRLTVQLRPEHSS